MRVGIAQISCIPGDIAKLETRLREITTEVGSAVLVEMIDSFINDLPQILSRLSEANDSPVVSRTAHRLKGSLMILGATTAAELCRSLEIESREGSGTRRPEILAHLHEELDRVTPILENARRRCATW